MPNRFSVADLSPFKYSNFVALTSVPVLFSIVM